MNLICGIVIGAMLLFIFIRIFKLIDLISDSLTEIESEEDKENIK